MNGQVQRTGIEMVRLDDPDNQSGVLDLYRTVFGESARADFERRWVWSQVRNPLSDEIHRWTMARSGKIAGHLATMPQCYSIGQRRVVAHTPCDYMVHPDSRFHGLKLMTAFTSECPNCVTFDDVEATIAVNEWLRIRRACSFARYVFPFTPAMALRYHVRTIVKKTTRPPLTTLARWFCGRTPKHGDRTYEVKEAATFGEEFEDLACALSRSIPALVFRDRRYLEWRYRGDSPHAASLILTIRTPSGELVGYSVGIVEPGLRRGIALDLVILPAHIEALATLVVGTADLLRTQGATSMEIYAAGGADGGMRVILESMGFHRLPTDLQVMIRFEDPEPQQIAEASDSWHLNLGETEYSHHAIRADRELQ